MIRLHFEAFIFQTIPKIIETIIANIFTATQMTKLTYNSITKFVETISKYTKQNHSCTPNSANVYFEGKDAFKNKYKQLCIKPVFIELFVFEDKKIYINHKQILEIYDKQLCISFSESDKRSLPKNKSKMFILNVDFEAQEYKEIVYYPSEIHQCLNQQNINRIRNQIIDEPKDEFIETEIDPDAF